MVDIYRDAKRRGIYPPLFTDCEEDSCFGIYQIRWIKKRFFKFFFAKRRAIFLSVLKTVNIQGYSELREPIKTRKNCYPLIWSDLVNTKLYYIVKKRKDITPFLIGKKPIVHLNIKST